MALPATVQSAAGWLIIAIGVIHLGVTFVDYDSVSLPALWFVGTGFALVLIGGLNVITAGLDAATYGRLRGLRVLTLVADASGVVLGTLFTVITSASQPQGPALAVLFGSAALSQLRRRSPHSGSAS